MCFQLIKSIAIIVWMINYDNNNNSRDSSNNDGFTIIFDDNNLKNWRMAGEGKSVILKEAKEEDK